jgi:hypothetical protein
VLAALREADAMSPLPPEEFHRRMEPHRATILSWAYRSIADASRDQGAVPIFLLTPLPGRDFEQDELSSLLALIQNVGGISMNLDPEFDRYPMEDLRIAEWDDHPNALGHQLIASKLLDALKGSAGELGLYGVQSASPESR